MAQYYDVDNTNPLEGFQEDFKRIINQVIIKYNTVAEAYETFGTKSNADQYIAAKEETDTFYSYHDYRMEDLNQTEYASSRLLRDMIINETYNEIPTVYRESLLKARRKREIESFEEKNEYYRMLNGFPTTDTSQDEYFYIPDDVAERLRVDPNIPIHLLQDTYNAVQPGYGDFVISSLEGLGVIQDLIRNNPEEKYLNFLGSKRIGIPEARSAGNFEILYMNQGVLRTIVYDEFKRIYEECRLYFLTTIYQTDHRKVIEYYDNFIAMCIMLMAIWQLVMRQLPLGIRREFFCEQTVRMFYEAYNVPYDMAIDEIQQKQIAQHLNLLIQWKATNKCLFDITDLLGFHRINIYKYYLVKEQKFDIYGVPIVAYKDEFNNDTGEVERRPDYKNMYDVYFQKVNLEEDSILRSFTSNYNQEEYERITTDDPFWWEDSKLFQELWETQFNFVESKYISLAIEYSMTEMMFESIGVLKMLMQFRDEMSSIQFTLPKIAPGLNVTLFDAVILLCCLTCKKHHLNGEIIAIPTQVLNVLEYMHDVDNHDFVVDAFGFDFDLLKPDNEEGTKVMRNVLDSLNEGDSKKFLEYLSILSINSEATNEEKVKAFNQMFKNIRGLSEWISYKLSETDDRKEYEALKEFYRTAYYSKEMRDIFNIQIEKEDGSFVTRTAFTFFEYLYYINPKLYSEMFKLDVVQQYIDYIGENKLDPEYYTLEDYQNDIDTGRIMLRYDILNVENEDVRISEDLLYYYIDHIIYKLSEYVENIDMLYMRNDTETPLERLLIKMIKFFKSLTVDFIGLDIIFICDFKNENILRLFDEIPYMRKLIGVDENYNMLLSDVVERVIAEIHQGSQINLRDMLLLIAYLKLVDRTDVVLGGDLVHTIEAYLKAGDKEDDSLRLYDTVKLETELHPTDRLQFKDKIVSKWYSD